MRAVVPAQWGENFWKGAAGRLNGLARMGVSELTVIFPGSVPHGPAPVSAEGLRVVFQADSDPDCADFTADEPFLLLWDGIFPNELAAAALLHRTRRGAATLVLRPCGAEGGWQVSRDRLGRINYLEETPPVLRCEEVMACAGGAICEPMPGLPFPESAGELLALLRFWMERGELWGAPAAEDRAESRAAMGEEVTENPLYFL